MSYARQRRDGNRTSCGFNRFRARVADITFSLSYVSFT